MSIETPLNNSEQKEKETVDDNARKFIVKGLDPNFLEDHSKKSYTVETDWLKIGEGTEQKVVRKGSDNIEIDDEKEKRKEDEKKDDDERLLITKTITNGSRKAEKVPISKEKYNELRAGSILHSKKVRHEIEHYDKNDVRFLLKCDLFDDTLCMFEVEAATKEERDSFDPNDLPAETIEVTGVPGYTGYEIVGTLEALTQEA